MSLKKWKSRVLIGVVAASVTVIASLGVTFADVDLKGKFRFAMETSTDKVIDEMKSAIATETETKKLSLQEELQSKLDNSRAELQAYAAQQKQSAVQAIEQHARELIESREFSSEEQKQAYAQSVAAVQSRALAELNAVTLSEPAAPAPAVTQEVYGSEQP